MSEDVKTEKLPVLIIGGGICGLALAHGLHNNNIPYKVLERDAALTPRNSRDWAVACHWASPILASLVGEAKWSRIDEANIDPGVPTKAADVAKVLNGKTGGVENELPIRDFRRFLRSRLRALVAEGLDIRYGKKLERVSYSGDGDGDEEEKKAAVTAHFADGTAETGRLLVGADGSKSTVRDLLLGPERAALKRLPVAATFINASFTREQALFLRRSYHPLVNVVLHPDNMVGMLGTYDAADGGRPESWGFSFYISWRCGVEEQRAEAAVMGVRERLRQAKERSEGFADPLRSVHAWVPDDLDTVYWGGMANWDPSVEGREWDNRDGRVTLVGDAAHPMTYQRGQGLNHALADAGKLVELLSRPGGRTQTDLVTEYDTEMRARAGEEVRLSEMNTMMLHDWSTVSQSPLLKRGLAFGGGNGKGEEEGTPERSGMADGGKGVNGGD